MNSNEFYTSKEYNKTSEYKNFPAEMYINNNDINFSGLEKSNTGQEITTNTNSLSNKKIKDNSKNLFNKIFDSIKSIATTAAVAVASIVATTSFITTKPDIDLLYLNNGSNYVEYSISAKDIKEDSDYYIVISTTNENDIQFEMSGDGIYENKVEGLKPEWEYKILVTGKDEFLGTVTYFEKTFQTTKLDNLIEPTPEPEPEPEPVLPDYFDGQYVIPNIEDALITFDNEEQTYNISLDIICDEMSQNYFYKIVAYDENNNILSIYKDIKNANCILNIDKNTSICNIFFEIYATNGIETKLLESTEVGTINLSTPTLNITNVTISGANMLEINYDFDAKNYNAENITNLLFNISYNDMDSEVIEINYDELVLGKKVISVLGNINFISIYSSFNFTNKYISREIISEEKVFEFNNDFEIQYSVDIYNQYIILKPIGLFENVDYISVSTSETQRAEVFDLFYDIYIPYRNSDEITLTYYLTNESGEILSAEQTLVVDTNFEIPNYTFNYKNPNDIGVTYNSNSSINLYIDTNFMCEDANVYYQIKLTNYESNLTLYYTFKEDLAIITNLPNTNYEITYDVCKEVNGITYNLFNVTPSGTVNEIYFDYVVSAEIYENNCNILLNYSNAILDLSNVKVVGSNGEEIILTENDFTDNTENYNYSVDLNFSEEIESVTIYIKCNQYFYIFDEIEPSKIIGSLYYNLHQTFYAQ